MEDMTPFIIITALSVFPPVRTSVQSAFVQQFKSKQPTVKHVPLNQESLCSSNASNATEIHQVV